MEISQSISNSVPDTSGAGGNPNIFERTLSTELVARSGQTIMMAGLISENSSVGGSGTPLLSKVPLIGNLFKSSSNGSDRTELIMLITPTVIDSLDQWEAVLDQFQEGLRQIDYQSLSDE
jgi:general secretion pathway protein D